MPHARPVQPGDALKVVDPNLPEHRRTGYVLPFDGNEGEGWATLNLGNGERAYVPLSACQPVFDLIDAGRVVACLPSLDAAFDMLARFRRCNAGARSYLIKCGLNVIDPPSR